MKAIKYRLSLAPVLIGFLGLVGWMFGIDLFAKGPHPSWSLGKWMLVLIATGAAYIALEWVLETFLAHLIPKDKVSDSLWKRGIRAVILIFVLGAVILAVPIYRIWTAP